MRRTLTDRHAKRPIDLVARALGCLVLASLAVTAWHDVSKAWDTWFYHLPFASRLVGLTNDASYTFSAGNRVRFQGFPLFVELLQGIVWRITGRVECTSFVALASLPLLAFTVKRWFGVPFGYSIIALVAVPLVQIHAAAGYVDLTANACAAIVWLASYRALAGKKRVSSRDLGIAIAFATAAANAKFQLVPIVLVGALPLAWIALRSKRWWMIAIALPLIGFTPLKNLALYGNPVWPVQLLSFPFVEEPYSSSPVWLEHASRPIRFACSVLELGLRPIAEHARWSLDQWTPWDHPAYRMGGFFGGYVVVNLVALGLAAVRRLPNARLSLVLFGALTVVTSVVPQSHELRYYLVWMIVLVLLNVIHWARAIPTLTLAIPFVALVVVTWSTEGYYMFPTGDTFAGYVQLRLDHEAFDSIAPGERVCVSRAPLTFLYAPVFHPAKAYSIQEAEVPADCGSLRSLP